MATLVSPGVSITVTDESMYAPAGTGTVPLIVIATAENKPSPDGSGIAPYTTPETAGKAQLVTSQRDLLTGYGNPVFQTAGGTSLHGHELNEYGLQAAYSFLGIANRAYILRADVDLGQLQASATAPVGEPEDGSYWLDTANTTWGIKKWNGSTWVKQAVRLPTTSQLEEITSGPYASYFRPKGSFGIDFDFAAVYTDDQGVAADYIIIFQKLSSGWHVVGSPTWVSSLTDPAPGSPTTTFQVNSYLTLPITAPTTNSVLLQMDAPNNGTNIAMNLYSAENQQYVPVPVVGKITETDIFNFKPNPVEGDLWADYDDPAPAEAVIKIKRHNGKSVVDAVGGVSGVSVDISLFPTMSSNIMYVQVAEGSFGVNPTSDADSDGFCDEYDIAEDINAAIANAGLGAVLEASVRNNRVVVTNLLGRPLTILASNVIGVDVFAELGFVVNVPYSNWEPLSYVANAIGSITPPAQGTLWYDNVINADRVDLLYNNNGTWTTYGSTVTVSSTMPATGATNEIWVDASDLENYPRIYKRISGSWVELDTTDQVTNNGVLFADFRGSKTSSLDSDAPNPAEYPWGILAWNKRASGGNVKQYVGTKWVDYSGNRENGTPYMLRKAQRHAIVREMQAALASNEEIRYETTRFNLLVCPGYIECLNEMRELNVDRKQTAFILADTPFRLRPTGTAIQNWATNASGAVADSEEGLISADPYVGIYYPHGLTSSTDGYDVMVPATHMALRTIAFNDQVAYPWFAPAGYQRGLVTNSASTGYLDPTTGEYTTVSLSEGQRDVLYLNKINPIATFPNRGIVVFGQKTLNPTASALDRVNVARLVVYLREVLDEAVRPFLFEPNDETTRQAAKTVVDNILSGLITQRGLYDFLVVCDSSNNTPARIDRNELHIDVAIQPTKAVEFIYIPLRIQSTQG